MSEFVIETKNLTKHYKNVAALSDLDLSIREGIVFGFIGPNGAGKSTTIRILCGLLRPTSGHAVIGGVDVTRHASSVKSTVGYLPEDFGVYERMRVVEYLDFFAAAHRIPVRRRSDAIENAMDLAGVTHMHDYFMGTLSRGMRQRVGIAKTLVHDPTILLLDEPTSGLDPFARIEIRNLLKKLRDTGKTVMISSHILPELASVCDEVGILSKGRLVASGAVADIMARARQERHVQIELLGDAAEAAKLLGELPGVANVVATDNLVRFAYRGGLEGIPEIHRRVLAAGHKVVWLREVEADLEHAFISITGNTSGQR